MLPPMFRKEMLKNLSVGSQAVQAEFLQTAPVSSTDDPLATLSGVGQGQDKAPHKILTERRKGMYLVGSLNGPEFSDLSSRYT